MPEVGYLLILSGLLAIPVGLPLFTQDWARQWVRSTVTTLAAIQAVLAAGCLAMLGLQWIELRQPLVLFNLFSFQFNGTSGLMLLLISFIGWVTCRYSIRYLDGEAAQTRYFQWMGLTIASVGGMVLSADLFTFGLLWCLTSFGLHHLLLHYADRPAAQRAAWTKFIVSRLGDLAIVLAICLYIQVVPSVGFAQLAEAALNPTIAGQSAFQVATIALAIGVLAKSAQMPFHTWLPLTMETPTPVSALMHAGIVNAGGFLLVRASPLLSASFAAQMLIVVVGTVTACLASMIMLTQTSIKKKLAYSTIAQMGFMLMQCGLGAYSAAMLHILAHSLYKAYEFLSSGSVMVRRAAMQTEPRSVRPIRASWLTFTMISMLAIAWFMLLSVGQDPWHKPGGWLLTSILCAALTTWLVETMAIGNTAIITRGWITATLLLATYAISFTVVDKLVAPATISAEPAWPVMAGVLLAFAGLFSFQVAIMSPITAHRLRSWQVHAANGFYIESWLRRRARTLMS